jgi:hypothetical protein
LLLAVSGKGTANAFTRWGVHAIFWMTCITTSPVLKVPFPLNDGMQLQKLMYVVYTSSLTYMHHAP